MKKLIFTCLFFFLMSFFVQAQKVQEKPVFNRISKDSIDAVKNIRELLLLANPLFDYSGYEFVSFDISAITSGLEVIISSGSETISARQKSLISATKPKAYVHIEHMKVKAPTKSGFKMLPDVTFIVK